jgi:hypothetical protein
VASSHVSSESCLRLLEAATNGCKRGVEQISAPPAAAVQIPATPDWNPLSTSLTSLSTAFAWGSIVIAGLAIVVTIVLGFVVVHRAEKEAHDTAKKCADEWLAANGPRLMREYVELIQSPAIDGNGNGNAADEMGEVA